MEEKYRVSKIYEDDFGCEERAENYETQVIVVINDSAGNETFVKQADTWMYEQGIDEGDEVVLRDGRLKKALEYMGQD